MVSDQQKEIKSMVKINNELLESQCSNNIVQLGEDTNYQLI